MLHNQIKEEIKKAMLAKDNIRLNVMRGLVSACTNELLVIGKKPQDLLEDEKVLEVIRRTAKQRKDAIEQFKKGGREDLVEEDSLQLKVLEEYLPKLMDKDEIYKIATDMKESLGIEDVSKKGIFMSSLMKELKGKADGSLVKEVVDSLF